ncbi:hypothetical protein SFRURICE_002807, partial [Spodoptera frugiperda]
WKKKKEGQSKEEKQTVQYVTAPLPNMEHADTGCWFKFFLPINEHGQNMRQKSLKIRASDPVVAIDPFVAI